MFWLASARAVGLIRSSSSLKQSTSPTPPSALFNLLVWKYNHSKTQQSTIAATIIATTSFHSFIATAKFHHKIDKWNFKCSPYHNLQENKLSSKTFARTLSDVKKE